MVDQGFQPRKAQNGRLANRAAVRPLPGPPFFSFSCFLPCLVVSHSVITSGLVTLLCIAGHAWELPHYYTFRHKGG